MLLVCFVIQQPQLHFSKLLFFCACFFRFAVFLCTQHQRAHTQLSARMATLSSSLLGKHSLLHTCFYAFFLFLSPILLSFSLLGAIAGILLFQEGVSRSLDLGQAPGSLSLAESGQGLRRFLSFSLLFSHHQLKAQHLQIFQPSAL